ncbi:MAG: PsbP-related protein [Candidatus Altiarchaeota archaeon]
MAYLGKTILFLAFTVILSGCMCYSPPGETSTTTLKSFVCKRPYIRVGNECCLDKNYDDICDRDKPVEPKSTVPETTLPPVTTTLAAAATTASNTGWLTYTNADENFRIDYPADWIVQEKHLNSTVFFFAPKDSPSDNLYENVNIGVFKYTGIPTMAEMEADFDKFNQNYTDFKKLNFGEKNINGLTSYRMVFAYTYSNVKLRITMYVIYTGQKYYMVSLTTSEDTYSRYITTFDAQVKTFKTLN